MSVFATPRTPIGLEVLFRHDHLEPDADANDSEKTRTIAGVAWWFAFQPGVTAAILADHEQVRYDDFSPAKPTEKRWALHLLLTY